MKQYKDLEYKWDYKHRYYVVYKQKKMIAVLARSESPTLWLEQTDGVVFNASLCRTISTLMDLLDNKLGE